MTKLNSSPNRNTFQLEKYLQRCEEQGEPVNNDYVEMYKNIYLHKQQQESSEEFQENNLEYDLRSTDWILEKVMEDRYAQNLYAALCNNEFQRNDLLPILRDQRWSCSWRYAGGIIADMQQRGDYIDWYCSGIRGSGDMGGPDMIHDQYVGEGTVTDEIRSDLKRLGWIVIDNNEEIK